MGTPVFLPGRLDYVDPDNRVINAFADELDLAALGFSRAQKASTRRPGSASGTMLKPYGCGYPHQPTSSRKLEREASRNVKRMSVIGS